MSYADFYDLVSNTVSHHPNILRQYAVYEPGPISWNGSFNFAKNKGGALLSKSQIRYITARRMGLTSYVESQFQANPLRDTGVWGKQNDRLDRWIATGPDIGSKRYIQIGDHSSHWPGRDHTWFPSWGNDGNYNHLPYHS
jgi:hypothetical protein